MPKIQVHKIEISPKSIWQSIGIVLLVLFLILIREVLLLLFLAIVVVSAAQPIVGWLEEKRIPRTAGSLLLYFLALTFLTGLFYLLLPAVRQDLVLLTKEIPLYIDNINSFLENVNQLAVQYNFESNLDQVVTNLANSVGGQISNIFANTFSFLFGLLKLLVVFSLSFYMLVEKNGTRNFIQAVTPAKYQAYTISLVSRIQGKMGWWLLGQFSMMIIIFALNYLVLSLLGVKFALVIAVIGGLLEIIPYLGPIIATVPAVLAGFTVSPWVALIVLIAYIVIQQIENYLIAPLIMRKAVGLNPAVIILALLIGGIVGGVLGILVAVPVATALGVIVSDLLDKDVKIDATSKSKEAAKVARS